jgi:transcriptional regulator with XRE-family HTH domain
MDLGLRQEDAAKALGVKTSTVIKWELGLNPVSAAYLPAVIRFLGYDPVPEITSLPDRILAARRTLSISQKELARRLGVDPKTIRKWEHGKIERRYPRTAAILEAFIAEVLKPEER